MPDIKQDIQFSRFNLEVDIEQIGSKLAYWSEEATKAANAAERAKLKMKRTEQEAYLEAKRNGSKTDTDAKANAAVSNTVVLAEEAYLYAVEKANDLETAVDLIRDAISRMKEEVKLYVANYWSMTGTTGSGADVCGNHKRQGD
jgi:4-diphosphocytidyl-2C-methyl-D-erythritol kinase